MARLERLRYARRGGLRGRLEIRPIGRFVQAFRANIFRARLKTGKMDDLIAGSTNLSKTVALSQREDSLKEVFDLPVHPPASAAIANIGDAR